MSDRYRLKTDNSPPDVILVVEGVDIHVHKKLLSSASPVFERQFFGDFKEANEDRIELKEVQIDSFYDCLDIIYGVDLGNIPGQMDLDRLNKLLIIADRFDIEPVRMFCEWELNVQAPGQEVGRYLLASHYMMFDHTKDFLFSLLTSEKLVSWSKSWTVESANSSLDSRDLARLISVCTGTSGFELLVEERRSLTTDKSNTSTEALPNDAVIEVDGQKFPVNKRVMCCNSPFIFDLFRGVENGKETTTSTVHLKNVKADVFRDCVDIIQGKTISEYSPGTMPTPRLLALLDLSTRLSLSPVRLFCSSEMSFTSNEKEIERFEMTVTSNEKKFERYLLACHFNLSECKKLLLSRVSYYTLANMDISSLSSSLPFDHLNFDAEDIRALLSVLTRCVRKTRGKAYEGEKMKMQCPVYKYSNAFSKKTEMTDVILVVDKKEFHVNRMMLACISKHFHRVLLVEGKQKSRFVLQGVDPTVFELCLHVIYGNLPNTYKTSGKSKDNMSSDFLIGLLECALRFDLPSVEQFCEMKTITLTKGDEMDRFLVMAALNTNEAEILLAGIDGDIIKNWLVKPNCGLIRHYCPAKLSLQQLQHLTQWYV